MRVDLIDPLSRTVPAEWERFRLEEDLPASFSAAALSAVAWSARRPVRLALVHDAGRVVAAVVGDLLTATRHHGRYVVPGSTPPVGVFSARLLVGFSSGVEFSRDADPAARRTAVRAFERAMRAEMGRRLLGFVYEKVPDPAPFLGGAAVVRRTAPLAVLPIRWPSLDDYFSDLPRRRGRRLRSMHDEIRDRRGVLLVDGPVDADAASDLDLATRAKYHDRRTLAPLSPTYLRRLGALPGVRFFGHRQEASGALLAFDVAFIYRHRLMVTVVGSRDLRDGGQRDLYLDLYLQEIEWAISQGLTHVEWGPGMLDLKARFGAVAMPAQAVVALR